MGHTVGTYLVELLAANDIDTVFGIPGVHNLELYRGLAAARIRHVLVRHEQGAGFAADGFARSSGRPAAAFVISGPGLTNIMTAAAQAYSDSIPLLVVASAPVRASFGKRWGVLHELNDQTALASGVFGAAHAAGSAAEMRDQLRACLVSFRSGRPRPAYLEVPLDLLAEDTPLRAERFDDAPLLPRAGADQVDAAVRLLTSASRPLVIAGGGARRAGTEIRRLVESLDCPLVTTVAGKGVLAESHPANLGTSLPYGPTQRMAAEADVVLAVGTELSETDVYTGTKLALNGRLIRIDIDPAKLGDQYGADVRLWSDAAVALAAINEMLARRAPNALECSGWLTALGGAAACRAEIDAGLDDRLVSQRTALRAIKAALPADGAIFSDMTQIAYCGNYAYPVENPGQWFHPSGYGTLGFALPAAIGAKIAAPARAIAALAGDFGLQFTLGELMTAVEERLSLPIVVWNNAALGVIRDDMIAAGIAPLGVVGQNPDFVALAHACGAEGYRVHDPAALTEAVHGALGQAGPTVIDVVAASF
ncbi:MAG TPA: 5-guanidino-2-oxopentanoate decarboxylase [Steroidobacteraceae bacterium]|jgi:5-guanidino-2-oxopentanoate decarboxylase|nr:5-guanidino-2-oxopentanoate decarboxylase [Steroidobacteraceae bacterium]